MRDARKLQAKQTVSPAYGKTETIVGDDGCVTVAPKYAPMSFQEHDFAG